MTVRIVAGEISAKDATVRAVIPTVSQPRWPPLERVAETIATPRRRFPAHGHIGVEVLTYVVEGSGLYAHESGSAEPVTAGAVRFLTAATTVPHAINPGKGQTLRWFAVVATLPTTGGVSDRFQSAQVRPDTPASDGTRTTFLVGAGSSVRSLVGMEAYEVGFIDEGTTFRKVGHSVNAVAYALAGAGNVDGHPVGVGEAAIIEGSAGVAIHGMPGFRLVMVQVPRPV